MFNHAFGTTEEYQSGRDFALDLAIAVGMQLNAEEVGIFRLDFTYTGAQYVLRGPEQVEVLLPKTRVKDPVAEVYFQQDHRALVFSGSRTDLGECSFISGGARLRHRFPVKSGMLNAKLIGERVKEWCLAREGARARVARIQEARQKSDETAAAQVAAAKALRDSWYAQASALLVPRGYVLERTLESGFTTQAYVPFLAMYRGSVYRFIAREGSLELELRIQMNLTNKDQAGAVLGALEQALGRAPLPDEGLGILGL